MTNTQTTAHSAHTRPLRGVAIGAGYFAPFQYEAWTRLPGVTIVALSNRTESRAREIMSRYGVPAFYEDWREMIDRERPDFVDIVTPPDTHEVMCAYAAARGVHIICQKPLAPSFDESERIVRLAEAAGVRFMVHENWRWQPWYREIKRIQEAGTIGDFTHIDFKMRMGDGWGADAYLARQPFFRQYPRLLIYETGVHFIDTFRFLLGEVASTYARTRRLNPVIKGEDAGQLLLAFSGGATALWDANRYNEAEVDNPRYTFGQLRIDATRGHLTMDTDSRIRIKRLGEPGTITNTIASRVTSPATACTFCSGTSSSRCAAARHSSRMVATISRPFVSSRPPMSRRVPGWSFS